MLSGEGKDELLLEHEHLGHEQIFALGNCKSSAGSIYGMFDQLY